MPLILPTEPSGAREKTHDAIRALLQDIRDTWGIRVVSVNVEWTKVGTAANPREIITSVNTDARNLSKPDH